MFRFQLRRAASVVIAPLCGGKPTSQIPDRRFYSTKLAAQMIRYAFSHARSQRTSDSYAQALLVLEQGTSNLRAGKGVKEEEDAVGMLELAMSTLLYERGDVEGAMEKLRMVRNLGDSSVGNDIHVAALEGLVGLNLEAGKDITSSAITDECLQLLKNTEKNEGHVPDKLVVRCKASKGLVDLVLGDLKSAGVNFGGSEQLKLEEANVAQSYGEFHHVKGNLELAKNFYEKAAQLSDVKDGSESSLLSAVNMVAEETSLGATCALGQLLALSGNFQDSEELLTKALTKAEEFYGLRHPKIGTILTCMAVMFGQKAKLERSSSLIIQEGLYRRAIELLKAPSLDIEDTQVPDSRRDIVALARGGYAEALRVQQNRKDEGERMKKWAETVWGNHRLSLAEALGVSEPAKAAVVDTRISRVL